MESVRYDDSLPIMLKILSRWMNAEEIAAGVVLRDVSGRLSFFARSKLDEAEFTKIETELLKELGPYARQDRVLASGSEFGNNVLADVSAYEVTLNSTTARVVDRRLVGMDWLRKPAGAAPPPRRFVFASLKGGVGRSTALSVAALHLANQGKRVLVLDLDLEAPGVSTMLLTRETLPRFGVVDALVENGVSGLDEGFIQDLIGSSSLSANSGRIDVIPAFGAASLEHPADILGKLARAYAEDVGADGKSLSILDQVQELVGRFSDPARYDAIFVDARAGLHETTASAILGLGADIFFFGLNEEQTFQGYQALFAHLARLRPGPKSGWLDQITMVQAKASITNEDHDLFTERCNLLFQASGLAPMQYPLSDVPVPAEPFKNVPWEDVETDLPPSLDDDLADRTPLFILDDDRFKHYSPELRADLMLPRVYLGAFETFLERIDETLAAGENGEVE
jgi:NUBPL iron-transfer P-loop NTPase